MQPDPETQTKLRDYANPTCGYRRGEGGEVVTQIFDGELPKGWADSPANVDDEWAPPEGQGLEPPYDQYGIGKLRTEIKRRTGKGPSRGWTIPDMVEALEDLDAAPDESDD